MTINKSLTGTELTISLQGRLDATNYMELDEELSRSLAGVTALVFDLKELDYISSAGLRCILSAKKIMDKQGTLVIRNSCELVYEVFEVTGFTDILTIE